MNRVRLLSVSSAAAALALVGSTLLAPAEAVAADGPLDETPAFSLSAVAKPGAEGVAFSNRVGLTFDSVGLYAMVGFDRRGAHNNGDNVTGQRIDAGIGGRYLFSQPERAAAAPYVYAQATTDRRSSDTDVDALDDFTSDQKRYSLAAGFGGEVALTPALTIAAELGLAHDVQNYEDGDFRRMTIHTHLDTGLSINVYF